MWLEPAEGYDQVIFRTVSWKQVYHWPAEVGLAGCPCQAEQLQSAAEDLRLHLLWINFPLHRQWEHGTAAKESRRLRGSTSDRSFRLLFEGCILSSQYFFLPGSTAGIKQSKVIDLKDYKVRVPLTHQL